MAPTVVFECGLEQVGVGAIGLACKAHIDKCQNSKCQKEVVAEAKKAGLLK